jgi:uncharacterized protein YbcI
MDIQTKVTSPTGRQIRGYQGNIAPGKMATTAHRSPVDPHWEEEAIAAMAREVVRIHARNFGSDPAEAEVTWQDDFLICMLEGALTETERRLIEGGRFDRVRADRRALHDVLEPTYTALVETLTGRGVRAYMSEVDASGAAFEAFILAR